MGDAREAFLGSLKAHYAEYRTAHPEGAPFLVALDGRCGSGKTTLAEAARQELGALVIHTDDYYLPFDQRIANWREVPCANMDLPRLLAEAILPAREGRELRVRAFRPRAQRWEEFALPASDLVIVEGSYSLHPLLYPHYDLRYFVTCTKEEQLRRLQLREGAHLQDFLDLWIPLEEGYYREYHIPNGETICISTDR